MNKILNALALAGLAVGASGLQAAVFTGRGTPDGTLLGQTTANAMAVNPDGVGHVLILPYFSVQNGNATVITLSNVDNLNGKAVKLRFRGAANADNLMDLTLFLSPNDVWNGVVTQNAVTGLAQLSTDDATCTLPVLAKGVSTPFTTNRINPGLNAADQATQTREGYAEVITLADIPVNLAVNSLSRAITHVNGVPGNCASPAVQATLTDAATEGVAAAMGFATPTTGLQGNWTLINVPQTLTFAGSATALQAVDVNGLPARANYVLFPQSSSPALAVDNLTADPLFRSNPAGSKTAAGVTTLYAPAVGGLPVVRAALYDFPDLSTPYLAGLSIPTQQTVATSKALAVKSVSNDYSSDSAVSAATDWLFSLPTLRYSKGLDYRQATPTVVYSLAASAGNVEYFSDGNSTGASALPKAFYDRDGTLRRSAFCATGCDAGFSLKGAVSLVTFSANQASAVGGRVAMDSASSLAFTNGWGVVDTSNGGAGLPVLGAAFIRANNPAAAAGVSGNYGISSTHSVTR